MTHIIWLILLYTESCNDSSNRVPRITYTCTTHVLVLSTVNIQSYSLVYVLLIGDTTIVCLVIDFLKKMSKFCFKNLARGEIIFWWYKWLHPIEEKQIYFYRNFQTPCRHFSVIKKNHFSWSVGFSLELRTDQIEHL